MKKHWRLSIPMFLFLLGVMSGLDHILPDNFIVYTSYFVRRIVLIGLIGIIYGILEITNINEKKVHFTIGIGMILLGFSFDFLTM